MSWDSTWESILSAREWGRYPPEEVVRFTMRRFGAIPDRGQVRILELGCGSGANTWFLSREGFTAHAIDGSISAIERARKRMSSENLNADLQVGDVIVFDTLYPPSMRFDAILDICCLQHNRLSAVQRVVSQVWERLNTGGRFMAMMLAEDSYGSKIGREIEPGTVVDVPDGPLKGLGLVHFFTLAEVQELFCRFSDVRIEYSLRSLNERQEIHKHWVVEGVKRT